MTTQPATRVTMEDATSIEAVTAFVGDVLSGSGWQLDRVRQRSSRLDPPNYWTLFEVSVRKDEATRSLRMVAAGAFDAVAWERLQHRLEKSSGGRACDPLNGVGYPQLFPESQHAYWFYPYDP